MDDLEDRVDSQGSFPDAERAVQAVISIKCSRQEAGPSNMSRRSSGATLSEGPSSDIGRDVLAFRTGASILFAGTPSNCRVALASLHTPGKWPYKCRYCTSRLTQLDLSVNDNFLRVALRIRILPFRV